MANSEYIKGKNLSFRDHEPDLSGFEHAQYQQLKHAAAIVADKWVAKKGWFPTGAVVHRYPDRLEVESFNLLTCVISAEPPTSLAEPPPARLVRKVVAYQQGGAPIQVEFSCNVVGSDLAQFIGMSFGFYQLQEENIRRLQMQEDPTIELILQPFPGQTESYLSVRYHTKMGTGEGNIITVGPTEATMHRLFTFDGQGYDLNRQLPEYILPKHINALSQFNKDRAVAIVEDSIRPTGRLQSTKTPEEFRDVMFSFLSYVK